MPTPALAPQKTDVEKLAKKAVAKGKLTDAQAADSSAATLGRITPGLGLSALHDCDVVIEAVIEDLKLKEALYGELGRVCKPDCILASNTSSLSITTMAGYCGRPSHMIGCEGRPP